VGCQFSSERQAVGWAFASAWQGPKTPLFVILAIKRNALTATVGFLPEDAQSWFYTTNNTCQ
jgi:hypothetical protein